MAKLRPDKASPRMRSHDCSFDAVASSFRGGRASPPIAGDRLHSVGALSTCAGCGWRTRCRCDWICRWAVNRPRSSSCRSWVWTGRVCDADTMIHMQDMHERDAATSNQQWISNDSAADSRLPSGAVESQSPPAQARGKSEFPISRARTSTADSDQPADAQFLKRTNTVQHAYSMGT